MNNNKRKQLMAFQKSTDKSLQQLINDAYQILDNPIVLYDIDWNILTCAEGVITDDPIWNNHINGGTVENNIDIFIREGFIYIMTRPDKVVLLTSENLKYDRIFGKIFDDGGLPIAGVSVVASNKPFEDDDLTVTEAICKTFSRAILKIPNYQNYAQIKLDIYITMLIEGAVKDKLYVSWYVEMIYMGCKENLYFAVADIAQCDPTYTKLMYYRDLFKQARPAFKYSIYSNYIVIIMSTGDGTFYPKRCFNRLNRLFEQNNIKVGISSRFENLFELPKYYNEAVTALKSGLEADGSQLIFTYSDENEA